MHSTDFIMGEMNDEIWSTDWFVVSGCQTDYIR